jgi:hypothetical protein
VAVRVVLRCRMLLKKKTLETLRTIINEKSEYRSGPNLIAFFNELGFSDSYGQGFPSRWLFTDQKLAALNGRPEIDRCIRAVFDPEHFIGRIKDLDALIKDFNSYLAFDGWKVLRNDASISIIQNTGKKIVEETPEDQSEIEFLNHEFEEMNIAEIGLETQITSILEDRVTEIKNTILSNAPLATIFICGSVLEGIFLGIALSSPSSFNSATSTPKDHQTGKPKQFYEWTLSNFIDVAFELGYIKNDTKKFSHALRDFRNYIHPYQQLSERFSPDSHTAKICWHVLKAAITQIKGKRSITE